MRPAVARNFHRSTGAVIWAFPWAEKVSPRLREHQLREGVVSQFGQTESGGRRGQGQGERGGSVSLEEHVPSAVGFAADHQKAPG